MPENMPKARKPFCFMRQVIFNIFVPSFARTNTSSPPLKLRPYGGIEMCVLLLLLLLLNFYQRTLSIIAIKSISGLHFGRS